MCITRPQWVKRVCLWTKKDVIYFDSNFFLVWEKNIFSPFFYEIIRKCQIWTNNVKSWPLSIDPISNIRFIAMLGLNESYSALAPVPLSIFRSNSKFAENSKHSSVKYLRPITTIFCTRHDSVTVVTCAKYRCDRSSIFETRAFWIFIEFRIRSKYA